MSTPNFCAAASAPECTVSQKMCDVALGITAMRRFLLVWHELSSSSEASVAASLLRTPTPIDHDIRAGDEGSICRTQEQRQFPDILRIAPTPHGCVRHELLALRRIVDNSLGHFGRKWTRADGHHRDALAP